MLRVAAAPAILLAAATAMMKLSSGDFPDNGVIPSASMATDCGGKNRSPALVWSAEPKAAKSFALIVNDPDAPIPGGFYHWVVYNLPATAHGLAVNENLSADQLGESSLGKPGYYGPCPPPGPPHHYVFTLYALDVAHVAAEAPLTAPQLAARVSGHVLARAVLRGTASHH
ncbi:MAG: YbhB/YbcL family Raf kinase inhibitor-like protein [Candidatus Cybelea sp.]